jgi:hypothetical protein
MSNPALGGLHRIPDKSTGSLQLKSNRRRDHEVAPFVLRGLSGVTSCALGGSARA